jgi:teichuronic acid biosynthesis glycosyltransferase TuaC
MKILVFTTLFPNGQQPNHATFVKERVRHVAKLCDVVVVAPVPYFPLLLFRKHKVANAPVIASGRLETKPCAKRSNPLRLLRAFPTGLPLVVGPRNLRDCFGPSLRDFLWSSGLAMTKGDGLLKKWSIFSRVPLVENIDGITVYHPRYFITPKIFRSLYGIFMFLSVLGFVKRLKKKFAFDLIDAHFVYPDGFAAVLLGKVFNKKVILNARGSDVNIYANLNIIRQLVKYALRRAEYVTAVSENLRKKILLLGIGPDKVKVVPSGVDTAKFFRMDLKEARQALGLPQDKKIIVSVGHLIEGKGFQFLVEAMSLLKREDAELFIIGEGEYRAALEKLIDRLGVGSRVKGVGERPHEELYKWYSAADLFCLTSLREGRPNVVLEALSCGTPVVSMDQWGLSELIDQDRGILLNSYDPSVIVKTIDEALAKTWDRQAISAYMKDFSWEKTAEAAVDIFKQALKKKDILFFSSDDWDSGLKTSKFHLAIRLAKTNRVVFIESIGLRSPKAGKRDLKKIFYKTGKWLKGLRRINENLFVFTPLVLPWHSNKFAKLINPFLLRMQMTYIKNRMNMKDPVYWTFLPNTVNLLRAHSKRLVYYCVDNMSAFEGVDQPAIRKMDDDLTQLANVVFAVSQPIYKDKKILNGNTYYIPHGVNYEHFANGANNDKPALLSGIPSPIIGFYGLISRDWVDFDLVSRIAKAHPEWSVVMIGKIDAQAKDLPAAKNIYYLRPIAYDDLPSYGKHFDVAMIPFNINELTLCSNPLKLYEYFAMGKPVVSVDLPEIRHLDGMVRIAKDHDQFVECIETCLKGDGAEIIAKRIEFARNNSWDRKVEEILAIVEKHCGCEL